MYFGSPSTASYRVALTTPGTLSPTSARLIARNSSNTEIDTFTQELRLTSSGGGSVNWMIGGYYFDEEVDIANELLYGQDFRAYADALTNVLSGVAINTFPSPLDGLEFALGLPAGTFFAPGQGRVEFSGQDNQAFSIFGQFDFALGDRATLVAGRRPRPTKTMTSIVPSSVNSPMMAPASVFRPWAGRSICAEILMASRLPMPATAMPDNRPSMLSGRSNS